MLRKQVEEFSERAAAKINLGLSVEKRLPDGYHFLRTLFARLELADDIFLSCTTGSGEIFLEVSYSDQLLKHMEAVQHACPEDAKISVQGMIPEKNLVVKAGRLFLDKYRIAHLYDLRIRLHKRIPMGAGLGGGSADAAGTLLALRKLFNSSISIDQLSELASGLGSDIPALLRESPVLVLGTGANVYPCRPINHPDFWYSWFQRIVVLVLKPPFPVATERAYSWLNRGFYPGECGQGFDAVLEENLSRARSEINNIGLEICQSLSDTCLSDRAAQDKDEIDILGLTSRPTSGNEHELLSGLECNWLRSLRCQTINDFEAVVFSRYPELCVSKLKLVDMGAASCFLTGSGSSIVALYSAESVRDQTKLEETLSYCQNLKESGWFVCWTKLYPNRNS